MKKASIISVGNEIVAGLTIDTNAAYLAQQLSTAGIPTANSYTVRDEIAAIANTMESAAEASDIILVTGGLGPTDDDLTRQAFAEFLGVELELDEIQLQKMEAFFVKLNKKMAEKNRIQAYIPIGAASLDNPLGTAPGIMAKRDEKVFVAMPGVPSEMKRMFADSVLPGLAESASGQAVISRRLKCFGIGESNIAEILGDLMRRDRNPLINCTVHCGVITLHIIAAAAERSAAEKMISADMQMLRGKLGALVFGCDDETLAEVVVKKLIAQNKTISTAESCTGGIIAKMITDVPGASDCFNYGWVTYSNDAKVDQLGVGPVLINEHGAVSEAVAEAMAIGARQKSGADLAVAVTGIAGPGGGSEQKPVGLVYIAVSSKNGCETRNFHFTRNDRDFIRTRTAQTALDMLRAML